jgi:hypothetical protein
LKINRHAPGNDRALGLATIMSEKPLRNASGETLDRHIGASKVEISAARMPVSANTKNNMKFAIKATCMGHSA